MPISARKASLPVPLPSPAPSQLQTSILEEEDLAVWPPLQSGFLPHSPPVGTASQGHPLTSLLLNPRDARGLSDWTPHGGLLDTHTVRTSLPLEILWGPCFWDTVHSPVLVILAAFALWQVHGLWLTPSPWHGQVPVYLGSRASSGCQRPYCLSS